MKYFILNIILALLIALQVHGKTTIECFAPAFKGQIATLVTYQDYVSLKLVILDKGIIDENGKISFQCDAKQGMRAMIQIQDKSAIIYLDPATPNYKVSFPKEIENVQTLTGNSVRLIFDSLPKNDLNTLVLEFNLRFDYFLYGDTLKVQRLMRQDQEFRDSLSLFTQNIFETYKEIDNDYFKDFYKYSIASIALFSNRQDPEKNKYVIFETFVKAKPILYHNDAYMLFIKDFYKDLLSDVNFMERDKVTFAVNNAGSKDKLDEAMGNHYYLKNAEYREFVMINALEEAYNTTFFNRENIRFILGQISQNSPNETHKKMAKGVLDYQEKLAPGTEAPLFSWVDVKGKEVTLKELRGKYVYLTFWATWNKPSLQEMLVIKQLQEKYSKYVTFVSISLDANKSDYEKFMKTSGKDFDWNFGYYNGDSQLLEDYAIRNVPFYLLIDMEGNIEQAPAYAPSPNGTYKSIDETFFYIKKRLEPKEDFKVGRW